MLEMGLMICGSRGERDGVCRCRLVKQCECWRVAVEKSKKRGLVLAFRDRSENSSLR